MHNLFAEYSIRFVTKCFKGKCKSYVELPRQNSFVLYSIGSMRIGGKQVSPKPLLLPAPLGSETGSPKPLNPRVEGTSSITSGFSLGKMRSGEFLRLGAEDLWRHIGVFGTTGSGKSHTVGFIVSSLARTGLGCSIIVLDWHNEYSDILETYGAVYREYRLATLPLIPFCPHSITELERQVDIIRLVLGLSVFQANVLKLVFLLRLSDSIPSKYSYLLDIIGLPDLPHRLRSRDILSAISSLWASLLESSDTMRAASRAEREVWLALIRRLELIFSSNYSFLFACSQVGKEANSVGRIALQPGIHVLRLGEIQDTVIRRIYALLLLETLFRVKMSKRSLPCSVVVLEEASSLLSGSGEEISVVEEVLSEARKYRLGVILVSQSLQQLARTRILTNINTFIIHRLHSSIDLSVLSKLIYDDDVKKLITILKPGEAIVSTPSLDTPVLIRVPHPSA